MKEQRNISGKVETRAMNDGENPIISGYGAVFNSPTDMGWFIEKIDSKAFNETDMSDVISCFNHDEDELLSRTTGKEDDLNITIDGIGLKYEYRAKNECALEVAKNIELKFVNGSSYVYEVKDESWEYDVLQSDGTQKDVRTILKIKKLYELGPVVFPAYQETTAELRSMVEKSKPKPKKSLLELRLLARKK